MSWSSATVSDNGPSRAGPVAGLAPENLGTGSSNFPNDVVALSRDRLAKYGVKSAARSSPTERGKIAPT
jgi:hypothetical protein